MSPTIRIDDEVYALLQERAEAFIDTPNTVLRRILDLEPSTTTTAHRPTRRDGEPAGRKLARMISAGLLAPDEELVWERRNNGERHTARVGPDGTLTLDDGHVADSPSAAARHLAGYEVNGWRVWRRSSDGMSLGELSGGREGRREGGGRRGHRRGERGERSERGDRPDRGERSDGGERRRHRDRFASSFDA
jgi:Restriction Enzyme Adenine Methylase Associated